MYICKYVSMYLCMHVCINVFMEVCGYVYIYVLLYSVSVYVIVFVCKFVWITLCKYLNVYEETYVCNKIRITIFCKYAFKFATYEKCIYVFMFIQVCSFICFVGYVCLSIVEIVYFILYKSIYVTQFNSFLSFFLSFSNNRRWLVE